MGCHTQFYRPLEDDERQLLRSTAKKAIEDFYTPEGDWDPTLYENDRIRLLQSVDDDTDYWIENGMYDGYDFIRKYNGILYLDVSCRNDIVSVKNIIPIYESFIDTFRVRNYPSWIIHNKRQLRRKLRKKYFDLTKEQHEKLSRFWELYPDGIITFS